MMYPRICVQLLVGSVSAIVWLIPGTLYADTEVSIKVPSPSRVSVAIYNDQRQLVRTLLTGKPLSAGEHKLVWDGLDRYGHALPPGRYHWKLLATSGLRAEYITQVGQNVNPVWERATGNHMAPNAVAIDESGLYRFGAENEGAHWGVKTHLNGRHLWTNDRWWADPWAQKTLAVTVVGDRLFELLPNGHVYGYHKQTGRCFTQGDFDPKPWNLRWKRFESRPDESDEKRRRYDAAESARDLSGDSTYQMLVAAFPQYDAIAWYSAQNGELIDVVEGVGNLAGIAVGRDGLVYAISNGAVITLSRNARSPHVLVPADRLQSPWRIAVSRTSGDLYIAENSEQTKDSTRHHQVKRFASNGEFRQPYGRPEGRADGAYIATDFRGITDIEADHEGGFVVTEGHHTPPRRSARFDVNGKLIYEWLGAQHYGVLACPEPNRPRYVWTRANADLPGLLRWEMDYQNKTSRLVEVYQDTFASNPFLRNQSAHGSAVPTLFEHNGKLYIYNGAMGSLVLYQYDPVAKRIRPCNVSTGADGRAILWNDLNDDGFVSDDEIHQSSRNVIGGYINPDDMSIRTTPYATRYQAGHGLKPTKFTAGGTPIYDTNEAESVEAWRENGERFHPLDFRKSSDGSLYGSISDATRNPNEGSETHGAWYYNSCSAIDRLVKWSAEGKQLWSVGRHSPDNDHEIGSTAMPRGLVGIVHGCIVWADASDEEVARPTVWTEDGLYVDELLRVPTDQLPKECFGMFNTNEYPSGHLSVDHDSGDTYYYAISSGGGSPVYRITGWDGWFQDQGQLTLSDPSTQLALLKGTGLNAEYFNTPDCSGVPVVTRIDPLIYFNWSKNSPHEKLTGDSFSVRWRGSYEAATNENVRFQIRGSFPWRDKGQPTWAKLWIGEQLLCSVQGASSAGETTYDEIARTNIEQASVSLRAGERVALRLECGFKRGEAAIALMHDTPGLDRRAILPAHFYPEAGPVKEFATPAADRPEVLADFDFEKVDGALCWSNANVDLFGRMTGATHRVPGQSGMAIEMNSRGEFGPALFPIDEQLQLPDRDYSVSFWFRTQEPNVRLAAATRYTSYNNRWSDHVIELNQGAVRFQIAGDEPLQAPAKMNDNTWHHVVTTVGPEGQQLFIDGRLVATGKLNARTKTSNRLGFDLGPGNQPGQVAIDELMIYSKSLSAADVAFLSK